ncbi:MAG TPA: tetratricopeptide repeat protein, partial [Spirochaetota bacterium]|nr:tetratricopeptide repeat protein [Spirochaetota bacterium]
FLLVGIISFSFVYIKNLSGKLSYQKELKASYKKLFNQKNYLELIEKMDKELKNTPFVVEYLIYRGYSYFFLGEDEKNLEKRNKYFMLSLFDLRKAMAIGITTNNAMNLYFCIGKIYYYFGEAYYRLSIEYLKRSLKYGNKRKDLFYVLGLNYSYLGNYDDAIATFNEALKLEENDLVLLAIGISYYKKSDFENAKNYLTKVMKITKEPKIKEKSFEMFGEILFEQKKYDESEKYFDEVININENNSNAFFFKGEIYFINNNPIKARAFWRKTLEIDPSHIRALKRIYR